MKHFIHSFLAFLVLGSPLTFVHPGIDIVQDSRGNIYYTDLQHVWKVTPDGKKQVAVRHVYTHELYLDRQDNLYGEHTWYEGEATNRWGHYVWRLNQKGQITKGIPNTQGFLSQYSFVRDGAKSMYWVECRTPCRFLKKEVDGSVRLLATRVFSDVRWQYVTADGHVYFVNDDALHMLSPSGKFKRNTSDLDETPASGSGHNHNLRGIWSDKQGNIYVSVANQRKV